MATIVGLGASFDKRQRKRKEYGRKEGKAKIMK
jgi:hypothetical protein